MIIDCDTHFMPRDAFEYVPEELQHLRPVLKFDDSGINTAIEFPGRPEPIPGTTPLSAPGSGAKYPGNADMTVRLTDYQRMGIERQLLLPQFTGWWSYLIEPELATAMAHSWNVAVLREMRAHPAEILGVAIVALQDVQGAMREAEWAKQQGFKGLVIDKVYPVREHPYGLPIGSRRELRPLFGKAAALDLPIFLHAVQHGHRLVNLVNFQMDGLDVFAPSEGEMALASIIGSGLLDDFPTLQFILTEQGVEHIARLAQRLDGAYRKAAAKYEDDEGASARSRRLLNSRAPQLVAPDVMREKNKLPPSVYFRRNISWTIETEEPELAAAAAFVGADRLLFATDYPHDDPGGRMKFKDVKLLEHNESLTASDKALIRSENATGLFRL